MNKTNLRAKWGNYCNTDKLVDDMIELLTRNGHRSSIHGVCTVLDEYFTKKEPLIKLFITSNHYIGGMRIAVQRDFERDVDRNKVWSFCSNFPYAIDAEKFLLRYKDENGNCITDYLKVGCKKANLLDMSFTGVAKKIDAFDIKSGATKTSWDMYDEFWWYMNFFKERACSTIYADLTDKSVELKKGMKMSRAFNKVCAHYGIDKIESYNKLFAQYADLVSSNARKLYFVISLNPLDYLTMSNGNSWQSCHRISGSYGQGGLAAGGCISYMLDEVSIITYVVDNIDGQIHNIGKIYRQMYYYDDNLFIQSRLYPQGNDGATNLYEKFRYMVQEEFSELLNLESDEWTHELGPAKAQEFSSNVGHHYPDANSNRQSGIFYPTEKKAKMCKHPKMTIGHVSYCCYCGKQQDKRSRLSHEGCTI